ncbi:MAG: hypothetical protein AB7S69_05975 [Salinivirgaceae bacterium]
MDDLIQILFFVLTFALFVFSAIRKQKKPNNKPASAVDVTLESLFGIPMVEERQPSRTDEYLAEEDEYEFGADEGVSATKPEMVNHLVDEEVEEEKEWEEEESQSKIAQEFDLRKAVIYSEIINRKVY